MCSISGGRFAAVTVAVFVLAVCDAGRVLADPGSSPTDTTSDVNVTAVDGSNGRPASYDVRSGVLTITGNNKANVLVVGRDATGNILVNDGAVLIKGGQPTVTNTVRIDIFGRGGNDELALDESNGPMPPARMFGDAGDDSITGGSSADELNGGPGFDTIAGRRGNDMINGDGDDDGFVWDPGDGSDIIEGGDGRDALVFNGSNVNENLELSTDGARLRLFRNIGNVVIDADNLEQITFAPRGGADALTVRDLTDSSVDALIVDLAGSGTPGASDGNGDTIIIDGSASDDTVAITDGADGVLVTGLRATVTVLAGDPAIDQLVIDGKDGADSIDASALPAGRLALVLIGGAAGDNLIGSAGDDYLYGGPGDDSLSGQDGADSFIWNPGDGNDTVEGQGGVDALVFRGSNAAESISLSASGGRLRLFRNVGNFTIDADDVESVTYTAVGGADTAGVGDLAGTDVVNVNIDLASTPGSGTGDGQSDSVLLTGTAGDDVVLVLDASGGVQILGLSASVAITGSESATDRLVISGLAGDDVIDASALAAGLISLTEDGGDDNDVLIGSDGPDILLGGSGDDVLIGGPGIDVLDGGPGDNILIQ